MSKPTRHFECIALCPPTSTRPGIAAAAARAGGIGVLDLEFAGPGEQIPEHAAAQVRWLRERTRPDEIIGVRLRPAQHERFAAVFEALAGRDFVVVWTRSPSAELFARTPASRVFVEVRSLDEALAIEATGLAHDGLIACGHECGGFVGEDTTFLLVQKLLGATRAPVYARGGIGIHAATGVRAAGAAGVVLDDQLLLTRESPLSDVHRQKLRSMSGQETAILGAFGAKPCRVLDRPLFGGLARLKDLEALVAGDAAGAEAWARAVDEIVGFSEPERAAWPVGQAAGLAELVRDKYVTTGRFVRAILEQSARLLARAQELKPFAPGAELARAHGTELPIVQGPMTRVSDRPAFAQAIAEGGALPLIALALSTGAHARPILEATRDALGDKPWGVGILGFVPPELQREQIDEVLRVSPRFALIAGGRPDQAADLEAKGIKTYLHVPVPALLRRFVAQGARRFVFEGRECGGHVGPLASLPLWEVMIEALLDCAPTSGEPIHVLFAGGIHDARSTAIVSAMSAALVDRGIRCGVLMGTAYLFTREAVDSGAIVKRYQDEALACRETVLLTSGLGHANRVAHTAFADQFERLRRELVASGNPPGEVKKELEGLGLGRLRIAAKGITRDPSGQIVTVDEAQQSEQGMYLIGQVATMRSSVCTIAELHADVAEGATRVLAAADASPPSEKVGDDEGVAIVGMGVLLPGAQSPAEYWRNLLDQADQIREIPRDRWDVRLYFDADKAARDKMYGKWGAFADDIPFEPLSYRIPPNVMKSICPAQLITLEVTRWALADAGYAQGGFDRENTATIVGNNDTGGFFGQQILTRSLLPILSESPTPEVLGRLVEWSSELFPGVLSNVTAGRVANQLDLGGPNYSLDAACATSLIAIDLGVRELATAQSNVVIAGGTDGSQTPFMYLAFSKTQALSPQGRARVFDKSADGIVTSEGSGLLILKRLEDARRDGDRVYAVIRGVGGSSDGGGVGLTVPKVEGQRRALDRAFRSAGVTIDSIGLYEAHGTGTPLGDRTEVETLTSAMKRAGAPPQTCAVGSVKSLIGHTKLTAGVAGMMKAALALHHRTLPPHAGVKDPIDALADAESPAYLLDQPRPWLHHPDHPRRAAVSAFGFGGTNSSAVLEEYTDGLDARPAGADEWPCEIIPLAAADEAGLLARIEGLKRDLAGGAKPRLRDLAYTCARALATAPEGPRVALVVRSLDELAEALTVAEKRLRGEAATGPQRQVLVSRREEQNPGRIAFLFSGQGAQYVGMAREATVYFDEMRAALELVDDALRDRFPRGLSSFMHPPATFSDAEADRQLEALTRTHRAQPAIGAVSLGLLDLLRKLGLSPDMVSGHSFGELTALHAAGALTRAEFVRLCEVRGRVMAEASQGGSMKAVRGPRERVTELLQGIADVVVANHNEPQQTVISGSLEGLARASEVLEQAGLRTQSLPVGGPFHSPLMASAAAPLDEAIQALSLAAPVVPVYSNINGQPHSTSPEVLRARMQEHLLRPVEFVAQVEAMYEGGARTFVEVGPSDLLSRLVSRILEGKPHASIALDARGGGLRKLLTSLGELVIRGAKIDLARLHEGRDVKLLTLDRLLQETRPAEVSASVWWVNCTHARPASEAAREKLLPKPLVTLEMRDQRAKEATKEPPRAAPSAAAAPPPAAPPARTRSAPEVEAFAAPTAHHGANGGHGANGTNGVHGAHGANGINGTNGTNGANGVNGMNGTNGSKQNGLHAYAAPQNGTHVAAPLAPTESANPIVTAYLAYQETMRRFLALEEQALAGFLDLARQGAPAGLQAYVPVPSTPAGMTRPAPAPAPAYAPAPAPAYAPAATPAYAPAATPTNTAVPVPAPVPEVVSLKNGHAAEPPPALPEITPIAQKPAEESAAPALDAAALEQMLVRALSDQTGYPIEALGVEMDLEGELGIDSIRRVQFLEETLATLPASTRTNIKAAPDGLFRARTLREVTRRIVSALDGAAARAPVPPAKAAPAPVAAPAAAAPNGVEAASCARCLPRSERAPLPSGAPLSLKGTVILTEDELGIAPLVQRALEARGLPTLLVRRADLADPEALRRLGKVADAAAILHLAPLSRGPVPSHFEEFRRAAQIDAKSLFLLLTLNAERLQALAAVGGARVVAASFLGGQFGRDGAIGPGLPTGGASVGLLKSLVLEWPGLHATAVDFADSHEPAAIAAALVEEFFHPDRHVEVGYRAGTRSAFHLAPVAHAPRAGTPLEPGADWVLLVTGGARGITAEILARFAKPGATVLITGRSAEPAPEDPATAGLKDVPALRRHLLAQASQNGAAVAPARIEALLQRILVDREIRQNLAALAGAGLKVVYRTCDVRDPAAVDDLFTWIRGTFGRLDAVIHGAGVIEDAWLASKDLRSFDRVFDTKVDSAYLLGRHLPAFAPKAVVFFGSIAGRIGSPGQTDYAAANEVLNRYAWWLGARLPGARIMCINWGPWASVGMAKPAVQAKLRERGIIPIETEAGCRFFREEVELGGAAEVVAGDGPWATASAGEHTARREAEIAP
ncbi:type I polyketide synthase [Polyangium jinanense]|uniref:SDR family NAD(P)-dependent oxidoreductase n=1 Tax=Polyangium jinanense TaxID=2829994 RepID=A0A9X4AXE5_9BACT|nr:type I polyketide synthase [Polyangium jinanense]MDC3957716.1 SDR family NAD(P)-dependent oxidoreductase [Polyangium jinanense]MDC3987771.1 SDR family NAD(P)-dependent oxidoreductase [Polyangium jinanense]